MEGDETDEIKPVNTEPLQSVPVTSQIEVQIKHYFLFQSVPASSLYSNIS
jgi:hypothetical protein